MPEVCNDVTYNVVYCDMYFLVPMKGTSSANQMQDSQMPDNPLIVKSMQIGEAEDETGERSKQWVRALKGFCETTTFHGLRNVAEPTSSLARR